MMGTPPSAHGLDWPSTEGQEGATRQRSSPGATEAGMGGCGDEGLSPKTPTRRPRAMAKKHWQPNHEATQCAIASCGAVFGSWNLFSGRHHCRCCGRVVCADCSQGTVRVCDFCLRSGQAFDFKSLTLSPAANNRSYGNFSSLRRQNSLDGLQKIDAQPTAAKSVRDLSALRRNATAPCLQSLDAAGGSDPTRRNDAAALGGSRTASARRESDDDYSSCDTVPSSSSPKNEEVQAPPKAPETLTMPKLIKASGQPKPKGTQALRTIEQLAEGEEELAQKFKKLEAAYAHSSYYQGLLEYEPEALRALLMSEVNVTQNSAKAGVAAR